MAISKKPYEGTAGRYFATFERAEAYVRRGVAAGRITHGDAWVALSNGGSTLATIRADAFGRVWTDICLDAAPLIPARGPCLWDVPTA